MIHHIEYVKNLIKKGGPGPEDYYDLDAWIIEIVDQLKRGLISQDELAELITLFGDAFSEETMQGFAFQKPRGYAGDFEIIDRIYERYVSPTPHLSNWDKYWQTHSAAEAVRNRVHYLHTVITERAGKECFSVLNIASGPGRDMLHFFRQNPTLDVIFDCIEQDENAIRHAQSLCEKYLERISFSQKNALRFKSDTQYDLVWSAGLFDYFEDKTFVAMLKRFKEMVKESCEIVIGNFSTVNPSRAYMELFEWNLHHRSPQTLRALAVQSGFAEENISIKKEETGVNLFLHIKK